MPLWLDGPMYKPAKKEKPKLAFIKFSLRRYRVNQYLIK